jgi:catechol 2,3-dioxygenase
MTVHHIENDTASLGAGGTEQLLYLTEGPASESSSDSTGLYHFALLVPTRKELARAFKRLLDNNTNIQGCSDHLVSEAIYFNDPDGNGIEIYYDLPQEHWYDKTGNIRMATQPLSVESLLAELGSTEVMTPALHHRTTLGHVHLHVGDLSTAEEFYCKVLGFDLILRYGMYASFLSAGGYHHHIGLNTWNHANLQPRTLGSFGLLWYKICLPNHRALSEMLARIIDSGRQLEHHLEGHLTLDPSGNQLMLSGPAQKSHNTNI